MTEKADSINSKDAYKKAAKLVQAEGARLKGFSDIIGDFPSEVGQMPHVVRVQEARRPGIRRSFSYVTIEGAGANATISRTRKGLRTEYQAVGLTERVVEVLDNTTANEQVMTVLHEQASKESASDKSTARIRTVFSAARAKLREAV